jgi:hypothetical protein
MIRLRKAGVAAHGARHTRAQETDREAKLTNPCKAVQFNSQRNVRAAAELMNH